MAADAKEKATAKELPELFSDINKQAVRFQDLPAGLKFRGKYNTSDYAKEVRKVRNAIANDLKAAGLSPDEVQPTKAAMAKLEEEIAKYYDGAIADPNHKWDKTTWEKLFKSVNEELAKVKSSDPKVQAKLQEVQANLQKDLKKVQEDSFKNAMTGLSRSMENAASLNKTIHLGTQAATAKEHYFKPSWKHMFVGITPSLDVTEEEAEDEEQLALAIRADAHGFDGDDKLFRIAYRKLLKSQDSYYTCEDGIYKGYTFQHADGVTMPKPPYKAGGYPVACNGTMALARFKDPETSFTLQPVCIPFQRQDNRDHFVNHVLNDSWTASVFRGYKNYVEERIMPMLAAAEKTGATMRLHPELRQCLYEAQQKNPNSGIGKSITKLFKLEKDARENRIKQMNSEAAKNNFNEQIEKQAAEIDKLKPADESMKQAFESQLATAPSAPPAAALSNVVLPQESKEEKEAREKREVKAAAINVLAAKNPQVILNKDEAKEYNGAASQTKKQEILVKQLAEVQKEIVIAKKSAEFVAKQIKFLDDLRSPNERAKFNEQADGLVGLRKQQEEHLGNLEIRVGVLAKALTDPNQIKKAQEQVDEVHKMQVVNHSNGTKLEEFQKDSKPAPSAPGFGAAAGG